MSFANTPAPPYVAVIFTSRLRDGVLGSPAAAAYDEAADRMATLAALQPGYLGLESARGEDGVGVTVSYWRDDASVAGWRQHPEHAQIQAKGRREWYASFHLRVAQVKREAAFESGDPS